MATARFRLWEALDAGATARAVGPVRVRGAEDFRHGLRPFGKHCLRPITPTLLAPATRRVPCLFEALHLPFVNIFHRRLLAEIPDIDVAAGSRGPGKSGAWPAVHPGADGLRGAVC